MVASRAEYQARTVELCEQALAEGLRRLIVCMPTGAGKTHAGKLLINRALSRNARVVWLARGVDLIDQTSQRLKACGVEHGVVMRCHAKRNPFLDVQVCSVDTLRARGEAPDPKEGGVWVISDECHHDSAETRAAIIGCYDDPVVIGLTATVERGDRVALGEEGAGYQRIIEPVTIVDLQDLWNQSGGREGLVPLHTWSVPDEKPRKDLAFSCMQAYIDRCPGEPWIRFCESVNHARTAADEAIAAGFRAACIEGGKDCTEEIEAFKRGDIQVLTNIYRLAEGFDAPVRVVSVERGVSHYGMWAQMVGRALRPESGKTHATLFDPCGHVYRGWAVEVPRVWSLGGNPSKPAGYLPPLRQCLSCGCVARPGAACPRCGLSQPLPENPKTKAEEARLMRVDKMRAQWAKEWAFFCKLVEEYRARLTTEHPYKPQWVFFCFQAKFNKTMPWKLTDYDKLGGVNGTARTQA